MGAVILAAATTSWAIEIDEGKDLGVTLDATFMSKYIWRGYNVTDDPSFQPSVDLDLFGTGLGLNVWGAFALTSGYEELDELDYTIYYSDTAFDDESFAIDWGVNYVYYDFPNVRSETADAHEFGASVAFPNLIPLGESYLVPSYYAGYMFPTSTTYGPDKAWFHILTVAYDLPITPLIKGQESQAISLFADLTYNDGAFGSESGFSHSTVGVSSNFEIGDFAIVPMLNYQFSFEDTVNDDDEFYGGVSLSYAF
jgi:hypothetical protein